MLKCPEVVRLLTESEIDGSVFGYHGTLGIGGKKYAVPHTMDAASMFPDPQVVSGSSRDRQGRRRGVTYCTINSSEIHIPSTSFAITAISSADNLDERPAFDLLLQVVSSRFSSSSVFIVCFETVSNQRTY